jgi:hypothetical protein
MPPDSTLSPPGAYLLFAIAAGRPSTGNVAFCVSFVIKRMSGRQDSENSYCSKIVCVYVVGRVVGVGGSQLVSTGIAA